MHGLSTRSRGAGHAPRTVRDKGALLMNTLIGAADAAGVRASFGSRVESLVQASDGRVVGAIAHTVEGRQRIRARKGLVLTAGGFIYNDDIVRRYAPPLQACKYKVGTETDDGSGIQLGVAAGGEAIRMETGDVSLAVFPPNDLRFGICLTAQGQRFLNEDVYFGRLGEYALLHQSGRVYLLVDDEHFARPENFPVEVAAAGETIEEVEAELGLPSGALVQTVAYYNEHAARGEDPLFHKGARWLAPIVNPPYGVIDLSTENFVYSAFTLGGLWIDPHGRVQTGAGEAIPGLYAAGRTTSGVAKQGYSSGMSLGDGSFFGRAAGRHAMRAG